MIPAPQPIPLPAPGPASRAASEGWPKAWDELRRADDIQFAPVDVPEVAPPQPGWFEELLLELFAFLGKLLAPVGQWLGASWGVIQWALLALIAGFVLYWLWLGFRPLARRRKADPAPDAADWRPDKVATLALLEDAQRLAAEGRYDEATHLLLTRSIGQMAAARADWVEPSSTARELASLPALPAAARTAFGVMAERVERSLFALERLERADWEAARDAYARFALALPGAEARA